MIGENNLRRDLESIDSFYKKNPHLNQKQEHSPEKGGWEGALNIGPSDKRKTVSVEKLRTIIATERAEAEQRGRDEAVARIKAAEWVFVNQGVVCNEFSRTSFLAVCEEARTHKGTKEDNH